MARSHDEIMTALQENIDWRLDNKGNRNARDTASVFPQAWILHAPKSYSQYTWGVFYRHRFYGFMLTKYWRDVMELNARQAWGEKTVFLEAKKKEAYASVPTMENS